MSWLDRLLRPRRPSSVDLPDDIVAALGGPGPHLEAAAVAALRAHLAPAPPVAAPAPARSHADAPVWLGRDEGGTAPDFDARLRDRLERRRAADPEADTAP